MKNGTTTYHYIVRGRVQGVAFRYYTLQAAHRHGISGTVKNLYNGDVEVYAQGSPESIREFEGFLNTGPPAARVLNVVKTESAHDTQFQGFDVIY